MSTGLIIFFVVTGCLVLLPVTAYMVIKFGATGYFKAKDRIKNNTLGNQEKQTKDNEQIQ